MKRTNIAAIILFSALAIAASGQKGGSANSSAAGSSGSGTSSSSTTNATTPAGLLGMTFAPEDWPRLTLPDVKKGSFSNQGRFVACYKLVPSNSSSQPLVLERVNKSDIPESGFDRLCDGEQDTEGRKKCSGKSAPAHWDPCSFGGEDKPLQMGQELVVGIDLSGFGATGLNIQQLKLLNLNVTTAAAAPINATPLRPSFPNSAGAGAASPTNYYEPDDDKRDKSWWTDAGTRPPAQGHDQGKWTADTCYIDGDFVKDPVSLHYYVATFADSKYRINSGAHAGDKRCRGFQSSKQVPADPFPRGPRGDWIGDGSAIWEEMPASVGAAPVNEKFRGEWKANEPYSVGEVVSVERSEADTNNHEYLELVDLKLGSPASGKSVKAPKPATSHKVYFRAISKGVSGAKPQNPFGVRLIGRALYLPWPFTLQGDVIPTISVNAVYTPPVPGAVWQGNTVYPAGSVVTSSSYNGRYYTALTGGLSRAEPDQPAFPVDTPPTFNDGTLVWLDSGTTVATTSGSGSGSAASSSGPSGSTSPTAGKTQQWLEHTHYLLGDTILNPATGHYYTVVRSASGNSGSAPAAGADPFPAIAAQPTIRDGDLIWLNMGGAAGTVPLWQPRHRYALDEQFRSGGQVYKMIRSTAMAGTSSLSAPADPFPAVPKNCRCVFEGELVWKLYLGTPPVPAPSSWAPATLYANGTIVKSASGDFYQVSEFATPAATTAGKGTSGPKPQNPFPQPTPDVGEGIRDGQILWTNAGTVAPPGVQPWSANHSYNVGDAVKGNNDLYVMLSSASGVSGAQNPDPSNGNQPSSVADGDLLWLDLGTGPCGVPGCQPIAWRPASPFNLGDVVSAANGHSYQLIKYLAGISGELPNTPFPVLAGAQPKYPGHLIDGTIAWDDTGVFLPAPSPCNAVPPLPLKQWIPNTKFGAGDCVASGDHIWRALNTGTSGVKPPQPNFPTTEVSFVLETLVPPIQDGDVTWNDAGAVRPLGLPAGSEDLVWQPGATFHKDQVVFVAGLGHGHYYQASVAGASGSLNPFPKAPPLPLTWVDSGVTPPPTVAAGQPADQTVSLLNVIMPQAHSLSYFNLSVGFVASFVRPPTFTFPPGLSSVPPASAGPAGVNSKGCTIVGSTTYACPSKVHGPLTIDPTLVFTLYVPPIDAEKAWHYNELWHPGISFGGSLSQPTNYFYIGGTWELFVRNVQLFTGLAFQRVPQLNAPLNQPIYTGTNTPSTVLGTKYGLFLGVTYNLNGFISNVIGMKGQ